MTTMTVPFLRAPVFRHGPMVAFTGDRREDLTALQEEMIDRIVRSDATLDELAELAVERGAFPTYDEARAKLSSQYRAARSLVGAVEIRLADRYDIIVVEQGYGGVYVHTVELVEKLRQRWRVLLVSPEDPLFEESRHEDDFTVPLLKEQIPDLGYFSFTHIVRTVVRKIPCRLLFLAHRSQSLYLFDLVERQPTIIYCDGYFDGAFRMAEQFGYEPNPSDDRAVLEELHYLLGCSIPQFYGFLSSPGINHRLLQAGYFALRRARENWCWGLGQTEGFRNAFPSLGPTLRFEPPFTDPALFDPARVARERVILFTTTMHNIEKKGLPELVKAMEIETEVIVRCVVRQPERLPRIPPAVRVRMTIGPVKKPEMVELYHRVWLNCRVSREESSPLSILESMICEVPQIVSTVVAEQIPLIEDGRTGFVIHPDDHEGLARALRRVLGDEELRDRLGREARRRALEYALDRRIHLFERYLA